MRKKRETKKWQEEIEEIMEKWNDEIRFEIENTLSPPTLWLDEEKATLTMEVKTGDGIDQPYYGEPEEVDRTIEAYEKAGWTLVETRGLMRWVNEGKKACEERPKWLEFEKTIKIPKRVKTSEQLIEFLKKEAER